MAFRESTCDDHGMRPSERKEDRKTRAASSQGSCATTSMMKQSNTMGSDDGPAFTGGIASSQVTRDANLVPVRIQIVRPQRRLTSVDKGVPTSRPRHVCRMNARDGVALRVRSMGVSSKRMSCQFFSAERFAPESATEPCSSKPRRFLSAIAAVHRTMMVSRAPALKNPGRLDGRPAVRPKSSTVWASNAVLGQKPAPWSCDRDKASTSLGP